MYQERDDGGEREKYAWYRQDVVQRDYSLRRVLVEALYEAFGNDLAPLRVLDVGCGTGEFLRNMIEWGANPSCLTGTEFIANRIDVAKVRSPGSINWHLGELDEIEDEQKYDLVSAFTVLSSVLDEPLREKLIKDMWARIDHGGWLLVHDMLINNPRNANVRRVDWRKITHMLTPDRTFYRKIILAPPIARRVGSRLAYLLEQMPVLRSHFVYMAKKGR